MFETVGHHVFENRKPGDDSRAPFYSNNVGSFLGRGYYYWDDHLELAKTWGYIWHKKHGRDYYVLESAIAIDRDYFFDLVGNRGHQKYIIEVDSILKRRRPDKGNWPLGRVIEFLKAATQDTDDVFANKFPYKVIRAADKDYSGVKRKEMKFSVDEPTVIHLNPCYILCVIDKEGCIGNSKIVYSSRKED